MTAPWFAPFVVRDETTSRGRFVHLEFPIGLDVDARGFAELERAFRGANLRWTVVSAQRRRLLST